MKRTLLVSDGDTALGGELVRLLSARGHQVATTTTPEPSGAPVEPVGKAALVIPWNRRSPVSAHNLLLTVLNAFQAIDEAFLLDVPRVSHALVHELHASEIEKAFDYCLKPSFFLARELISYFHQKGNGILGLVSFCPRPHDVPSPALERAVRDGFKGFASSVMASYAESGMTINAFQSFAASPEDFALFVEKTLEEKARKISGRWFTYQPKAGFFQGMLSATGRKG
jgi:NAD(P)-dependent dehydrogenase (short-subunit alcohol dehydrogenase family)